MDAIVLLGATVLAANYYNRKEIAAYTNRASNDQYKQALQDFGAETHSTQSTSQPQSYRDPFGADTLPSIPDPYVVPASDVSVVVPDSDVSVVVPASDVSVESSEPNRSTDRPRRGGRRRRRPRPPQDGPHAVEPPNTANPSESGIVGGHELDVEESHHDADLPQTTHTDYGPMRAIAKTGIGVTRAVSNINTSGYERVTNRALELEEATAHANTLQLAWQTEFENEYVRLNGDETAARAAATNAVERNPSEAWADVRRLANEIGEDVVIPDQLIDSTTRSQAMEALTRQVAGEDDFLRIARVYAQGGSFTDMLREQVPNDVEFLVDAEGAQAARFSPRITRAGFEYKTWQQLGGRVTPHETSLLHSVPSTRDYLANPGNLRRITLDRQQDLLSAFSEDEAFPLDDGAGVGFPRRSADPFPLTRLEDLVENRRTAMVNNTSRGHEGLLELDHVRQTRGRARVGGYSALEPRPNSSIRGTVQQIGERVDSAAARAVERAAQTVGTRTASRIGSGLRAVGKAAVPLGVAVEGVVAALSIREGDIQLSEQQRAYAQAVADGTMTQADAEILSMIAEDRTNVNRGGSIGGAIGGAGVGLAAGALAGSVVPIVGNVIGGIFGLVAGSLGGIGGSWAGGLLGQSVATQADTDYRNNINYRIQTRLREQIQNHEVNLTSTITARPEVQEWLRGHNDWWYRFDQHLQLEEVRNHPQLYSDKPVWNMRNFNPWT